MATQIEALYRQHYDRMLLTARTLLGNEEEARDAVGDVFAELLASGKRLDAPQAESYLMVSVRNRCLNQLAHQRVVRRTEQLLPTETEATDYEEPPLEQVLAYVDTQLATKTSHAVKLRYLERKKYNEIARDMGISRVAVFKHLSQGIHKLRLQFAWYHALLALLLLSGVAYGLFLRSHRPPAAPPAAAPAMEQTAPPPTDTPTVVHYDNATLEEILTDITRHHHVALRFLREEPRHLRLHYDWHTADALPSIVSTLDAFERISLEYRQNTLYVR